eukprot:13934115-Ditylum_brightwellii.AAC.1
MVKANFKVQINPSKPSMVVGQVHVKTRTLSVYMLRFNVRITQELMLCVAPHVGHSSFKLVPASLTHDKSICNGKQHYANLLKEQNQYLVNYKDFCISGISKEMLSKDFDGKMLREHSEL